MGKTPDQLADANGRSRASQSGRWHASIDTHYSDLVGLVLCFVTGLCDSSAYNAWACFLAMQTGIPPVNIRLPQDTTEYIKRD